MVISVGLLYYVFVKFTGWGIPCFFNKATGFTCPGCGISRMLMAIIELDFVEAFKFNPALFTVLPFILSVLTIDRIEYVRYGARKKRVWKNVVIIVSLFLLIGFCIYRNIVEGFDYNSLLGNIINFISKK